MIELGALLMVLGLVGFVLLPDEVIERRLVEDSAPWLDAACFAIVVSVMAGATLVLAGVSIGIGRWLGV